MLWFDLDNSPHVPLFRPILKQLDQRGEPYTVTARDFAQTKDLLALWNVPHDLIGKHGGRSKARKILNLLRRSSALKRAMEGIGVRAAVSHGSRAQVLACWRMRIPSIVMLDYEYTEARIFNSLAARLLMPSIIPDERLARAGFNLAKIIRYAGYKEEVYLEAFAPQPGFRASLGVEGTRILILVRPPSTTGNYHNRRSESLFRACLQYFASFPNTLSLIVGRTSAEERLIPAELRKNRRAALLSSPVDGLQLIWHSDLVVSGGGTMNRESALLGAPTYSIFTGFRPFLDEHLQSQGRLHFIDNVSQVQSIPVVKRPISSSYTPRTTEMPAMLTELLLSIASGL